ncbi:DUF3806 domain-containing protein [Cellulomonas soli]|uniref:Uncharacterized protein n=1 Tax=Cellulomonas soli TaxID=931535 RepID=A0A512PF97_9CELL|nr:DUF3806 domain-containing protein [Cellulomonas soli]NYI59356.1 hypothetical protein [Cellulomonas soli]GEP69856.1 hypothetical protein CSO01_25710 [Cellulomonas soli]
MAVDAGPGNGHQDAITTTQDPRGAGTHGGRTTLTDVPDGTPRGAAGPQDSAGDSAGDVAGDRPLTPDETGHMDRLRRDLAASGVDVRDARAIGALYDRSWTAWSQSGGAADPRPLVRALGVGLGDVLAARADGAWMLRTTPEGAAPVVLTPAWCVAPLEEVTARWRAGEQGWVERWVDRSVAHLTGTRSRHTTGEPRVPTPARAGDERAPEVAGPPVPGDPTGPAPAGAHERPRTPDELPSPPSTPAQDLALRALAQAVDDVVPAGGPLAPFAMVDDGVDVVVRRFAEPAAARAWVRASGAVRAAIAWQGRLDDDVTTRDGVPPGAARTGRGGRDGNGREAVFVEACDRGRPGFVVAHRYTSVPGVSRIVGTPEVVGACEPLL